MPTRLLELGKAPSSSIDLLARKLPLINRGLTLDFTVNCKTLSISLVEPCSIAEPVLMGKVKDDNDGGGYLSNERSSK